MALKPFPKAIGIAIIVGAVGFGLTKALPLLHKPAEQTTTQSTTFDVGTTDQLHKQDVQAPPPQVVEAPTPAPVVEPTPAPRQSTVSNGGRGLDALMKAGSK